MNMVTHTTGGGLGVGGVGAVRFVRAALRGGAVDGGGHLWGQPHWTVHHVQCLPRSAARHGEKVLQVLDHCTIYFLIAGSYTPVALSAIRPLYPELGIGLAIGEWALTALAVTLTAIDLRKYRVFSRIAASSVWAGQSLFSAPQAMEAMGQTGFTLLLAGGIAYTLGSILYGIGAKRKWLHSVFHIFVVLGSVLHYSCHFLVCLVLGRVVPAAPGRGKKGPLSNRGVYGIKE
ncbi:MAG: PAQR family membrane homeostasis protein TrhA [Oscillospiraceae bacterium]